MKPRHCLAWFLYYYFRFNLRGKSVEEKNNEYCPLALLYCSTVNL